MALRRGEGGPKINVIVTLINSIQIDAHQRGIGSLMWLVAKERHLRRHPIDELESSRQDGYKNGSKFKLKVASWP